MSTLIPDSSGHAADDRVSGGPTPPIDYAAAEGFTDPSAEPVEADRRNDRTVVEGTVGHDAQTISLAPSQGGWVEFTLDEEGGYPFVTHAFGDMVKGALGVLATPNAPHAAGH